MKIKNFEFKVRVEALDDYEKKLLTLQPKFIGTDYQTDTYFKVTEGRLKLREGNIENALIDYSREDVADAKESDITLFKCQPDKALKIILQKHLGIDTVVEKERRIYFMENVKFHFDTVAALGHFIEVEAIDDKGQFAIDELKDQCDHYFDFFGFTKDLLVDLSYADLTRTASE